MPATGEMAARGRVKPLLTVLLLIGLLVGLTGCRGFFGQAPIALLVVTLPAADSEVPIEVTVDISASNDPDGTITGYEIDFGDGSPIITGIDVNDVITHTYMAEGIFTITLTITDSDGRIGMDTGTATIGPVMITFAGYQAGTFGIWRMEGDGSNLSVVRDTPRDEFFPDLVRGTRGRIAYAMEDGTRWNIWRMTVTGGAVTPLTTQTPSNQIQPSWSYDGTKIAFASNAAQTPSSTTWEIWAMNADGTTQTQLTAQAPSWGIAPAFSPTNDDLVFVSGVLHTGVAALGGSAILKRTAAGILSTLHDSTGRDGDASTAIAGLATSLNLPPGAGISKPAWSPDGAKIAFSTDKDGPINIYVMNADGTGVQTLEAYVNALLTVPVSPGTITTVNDEFAPYWLEDGSGLAFAKEIGTAINLYKVSFTTGIVTQITITTGRNVTPAQR